MRLRWQAALTFFTVDPDWKRKLLLGGALFYPIPPLGWLMAIGFRSLVGLRIVDGSEPLLPTWQGNWVEIFARGVKASLLIVSHFSPFLLLYWWLGLDSLHALSAHAGSVASFFGLIVLSPPLFLPTLPFLFAWVQPWISFTPVDIGVLAVLFVGALFILPASFVQIGLYGTFRAGFKARSAWRFVLEQPRVYLEAWVFSLIVSAIAISLGPLMPWGLFWSYLVILHLFVDALTHWDVPEVHERFLHSKVFAPDK
jgi:hypothetical protein